MKLLLDQNLSPPLVESLEPLFPGSSHVRDLGLDRSSDAEVWRHASENGYAIVTKDADFHERSLLSGHPPKVVWIRRGNCTTTQIQAILERHADDLQALGDDANTGVLILF